MADPRLAASIIGYLPGGSQGPGQGDEPGAQLPPVVFTPVAELPRVERSGATPGHYALQLLGPEASAAAGPVLVGEHCAECCTDDSCPRCWVASATVELELVPLPRA